MTLTVLKTAHALIESGNIIEAEYALTQLAEKEGDKALVAVLADMPSTDLLAILREYDSAKESLVGLLVTPEQFAQAVLLEKRYGDTNHDHLRGMINAILFREDANASDFLYAISETDGGYDVLADYLSDKAARVEHFYRYGTFDLFEHDEIKTLATEDDLYQLAKEDESFGLGLDRAHVEDHDWMEVTTLLRYQHPDVFREVLLKLRARFKAEQEEHEHFIAKAGELPEGVLDNDQPMPSTDRPDFSGLQEESAL